MECQGIQGIDYDDAFKKRCRDLIAFKEKFGHCNVPQKCANNSSLGHWCSEMRKAYKKIQNGIKTRANLSQGRIERLEEIGFQWNGRVSITMMHSRSAVAI
jgi:hypothetical protein